MISQREIDSKMKHILFKDEPVQNMYVGYDDYREQNNEFGWFGKDKPIPEHR